MLLSNEDINRIVNLGYNKNFFVKSKKAWLKLKNKDGRCIFHDGRICTIYDDRPEGCRFYPLIYNRERKTAIIDEECPYSDNFRYTKKDINTLFCFVVQIINERKLRRKHMH
jgi:hypothetical protein